MRYRTLTLEIANADKDQKFYAATLSSEEPVDRDVEIEVLEHSPSSVNMARAKRGLPLLWAHNPQEVIGRVEHIRVEGRKLRGDLRPGSSTRAVELWRDVRNGVLTDVSVGYTYNSKPTRRQDGVSVYRSWTPHEVSLVGIGADPNAGIGRSNKLPLNRRIQKMNLDKYDDIDDLPEPKKSYTEIERMRVQGIRNLCRQNNLGRELMDKMIDDGLSIDECSTIILKELKARTYGSQTFEFRELGMTQREVNRYSISRALLAASKGDWSTAGLEAEASRAMSQKIGKQPQGFYVPTDVLMTRTVQKSTGISTIATEVMASSFIDLLRAKTVIMQLGCTFLPGLVGDCLIPRQSATVTTHWVAESTAVATSDMTLDSVTLTPKTLGALTSYSRKMLLQSLPGIEQLILNDLSRVIAVEIDRAAINGSGSGAEPKGIFTYTSGDGIGIVTTSGTLSWAKICEFESTVANNNADVGNLGYLTSPKVRGKLKATFSNTTYGEVPIWTRSAAGEIVNGYPAFATSLVPDTFSTTKSGMIFGDWSSLLVGEWGVMDLSTDPYGDNFAKGDVAVRALIDVDIALRHLKSFAHATDIVTT